MSEPTPPTPTSPSFLKRVRKPLLRLFIGVCVLFLGLFFLFYRLTQTDVVPPVRMVQDVTELQKIPVERVVAPVSTEEVQALVSTHRGAISIGGGRFSMGGQIGTDGALFIDMREMDDVLKIDAENRIIRVEAGITWRKIQEAIDSYDLSVQIMQSYANFTVGGSISVNAHGRYVNQGPVVHSVRAIDLVTANGEKIHASRTENPEIFFGAIGGYGGLGVIVEVELNLDTNEPLERTVERFPVGDFPQYYQDHIEGSESAVFFNADLYPPDYNDMVSIVFSKTDRDVTIADRMQSGGRSSTVERLTFWGISELPGGKKARSDFIDKLRLKGKPVVWRNYEASYDVAGLDPGSRENTTYVLQEYFIPVENFTTFAAKMSEIFQRYDVNVMNVSLRHASADPDTYLTWAPQECFAFVIYHKQSTDRASRTEVATWTREMIDAILSEGGTYYLPYQIHATDEQFHQAYPRAKELFELKMQLDPEYKFRNRLWERYFPPAQAQAQAASDAQISKKLAARTDYLRTEDQTFLTLPEWYIVYSADELGAHLANQPPSSFAYFDSIGQFWQTYGAVWATTEGRYEFNTGYHFMIWVIGTSYTAEYTLKGLYENTVGGATEWWSGDGWKTNPEDRYYAEVAKEYGAFIHHTPWYDFPYGEKRKGLGDVDGRSWSIRGMERSTAVWTELAGKGVWAWLMGAGSGAAYGVVDTHVHLWVRATPEQLPPVDGMSIVEDLGEGSLLLKIPRYEPVTQALIQFANQGIEVVEIAGGKTILVQVIAPRSWDRARLWGDVLMAWPILTQPDNQRVTIEVPIRRLNEVLPALARDGATVEHIYDF